MAAKAAHAPNHYRGGAGQGQSQLLASSLGTTAANVTASGAHYRDYHALAQSPSHGGLGGQSVAWDPSASSSLTQHATMKHQHESDLYALTSSSSSSSPYNPQPLPYLTSANPIPPPSLTLRNTGTIANNKILTPTPTTATATRILILALVVLPPTTTTITPSTCTPRRCYHTNNHAHPQRAASPKSGMLASVEVPSSTARIRNTTSSTKTTT